MNRFIQETPKSSPASLWENGLPKTFANDFHTFPFTSDPFISWTKEMHGNAPSISQSFTQEKKGTGPPHPQPSDSDWWQGAFYLAASGEGNTARIISEYNGSYPNLPRWLGCPSIKMVGITRKNWDVIQSMGSIGILGNGEIFRTPTRDPWISMNSRVFRCFLPSHYEDLTRPSKTHFSSPAVVAIVAVAPPMGSRIRRGPRQGSGAS